MMVLKAVVLSLLVHCVVAVSTAASTKSELLAVGISEAAASEIASYDDKFEVAAEKAKTDPEGAKELVDRLHREFFVYVKTLPSEEQTIYHKYINEKNAQPAGGSTQ